MDRHEQRVGGFNDPGSRWWPGEKGVVDEGYGDKQAVAGEWSGSEGAVETGGLEQVKGMAVREVRTAETGSSSSPGENLGTRTAQMSTGTKH